MSVSNISINGLKELKVLIIEDDRTLMTVWSYILSKLNSRVQIDWVTTELEAEELIAKSIKSNKNYDLAIVDIFLEGTRTGLDFFERFKEILQGKIIISSGTDYLLYAEYLQKDSNPPFCLEKPLNLDKSVEVIKRFMKNIQCEKNYHSAAV